MSDQENMVDPMEQIRQAENAAKEIQSLARRMMPEQATAAADAAKQQGAEVFATQVGETWYVYRSLNRFEYQNMLLDQAKQFAALAEQADSEASLNILSKIREQNTVVMAALVYPKLDAMSIKTVPAGAVDTLYGSIMLACGFGQEPMPIKL